MNKKSLLAISLTGLSLLLTSCNYDKDPFLDFKNEAKNVYNLFYEKNPTLEKDPLFYFDIETLRGALVRSENDVSFLGQFKITDFTFSESTNYFADIGNLPLKVEDSDGNGTPDNITLGDFVKTINGNVEFDIKTFMQNLPLVLHEKLADGTIATYSMVNKEGEVLDSSNAKAYNPDFFYISDLSLKIDGLSQYTDSLLDFTGKDVCILRKDLYEELASLEDAVLPTEFQNFISISEVFNGLYRKSKGLQSNDEMPQSLTIEGTHYTNFEDSREVVVGPFSLINKIINQLLNQNGSSTSSVSNIHKVENIYINDGVNTVSFFAFNGERSSDEEPSNSKIKNVYLPSSLESVQFNAFSNLDLEGLYIPKTYNSQNVETPFETVDFGETTLNIGSDNNKIELNITGSFSHTNIKNIYFEDYDNMNIDSFPYSSTINLASTDEINKSLKIYHEKDNSISTDKFNSFEEAFNYSKIINPFYQMDMLSDDNNKYSLKCDVSSLSNGETIYLPHERYSLDTKSSRSVVSSISENEGSYLDAFITLKLDSDLEISNGGEIIIGSQIGYTNSESGVNVGNYAALDLNGHKLTVKDGGSIIGDGYIYDSVGTGGLVLENGATLETNLTINNYKGFNEVQSRVDNEISPFDEYSLNSLLVDVEVNAGATIKTKIDYVGSDFYNENSIEFISPTEKALYQLNSGKLVVNKSKISSLDASTDVSLNNVTLFTVTDDSSFTPQIDEFGTGDFPFSISNDTFKVTLSDVTINTKIKVPKDSNLILANLTLGNDGMVVSEGDNALYITNSISLKDGDSKATISGSVRFDSLAFNTFETLVRTYEGNLAYIANINKLTNGGEVLTTSYSLEGYIGSSSNSFTSKLIKNANGYYYLLKDNGNSGELLNNDSDKLASYSSGSDEWIAHLDNEDKITSVSKNSLITSFSETTMLYVIGDQEGKYNWRETSTISNEGTYESNGKLYIMPYKTNGLIEGSFLENSPEANKLFITAQTNKIYAYADIDNDATKEWVEVKTFDDNHTLKIIDSNYVNSASAHEYIVFINGEYRTNFEYDEEKHIATDMSEAVARTYAYTNDDSFKEFNGGLNWSLKQINSDTIKMIYLRQNGAWGSVDELHAGLCKSDASSTNFYYYFLINDVWYQSIEGEYSLRYNELADRSFGVLNEKLTYNGSKYKFVMKKGEDVNESFNLFLPQEMIKANKSDFSDLWPEGATTDHLYAYRHILKNDGKKYLYYKNETTGKVEEKAFEFAPGFTASQINPDNENILTKFNFIIYKVIFEGETQIRTIYVLLDSSDTDNAIYAGNATQNGNEDVDDDYLAIAIFTDKNPIQDLTSGVL